MCAGPLKPPSKPKPPPAPPQPPPPKPAESAREAALRRRRRAVGAFDSTIVTGSAGLTGDAPIRKKRLLGE